MNQCTLSEQAAALDLNGCRRFAVALLRRAWQDARIDGDAAAWLFSPQAQAWAGPLDIDLSVVWTPGLPPLPTRPCPDCGTALLPEDTYCPTCASCAHSDEVQFVRCGW
jgi:hypothetical protein